MKFKSKFFLIIVVLNFFYSSCSQRKEKSNKQDTTNIIERVPRYEDFVIDSNNRIDYFFKRFNVKKESESVEKRKTSETRTTAKGKYKNLDFTVTVYSSEGIDSSIRITFYFSLSKKEKSFVVYRRDNSYIESNHCHEYSSVYSPVQSDVPAEWGNYQCGRELSLNLETQSIRELCWDVKNQYQVDDCRDSSSFDLKTQQVSLPRDRNTCPHKCYEFIPYLNLGNYIVRKSDVHLRKEPSRNGESFGKLKLNEEVQVIEDTGPIEEIDENIAPWVKIKTKNGLEGYVFGIFLKKPKEFWN